MAYTEKKDTDSGNTSHYDTTTMLCYVLSIWRTECKGRVYMVSVPELCALYRHHV